MRGPDIEWICAGVRRTHVPGNTRRPVGRGGQRVPDGVVRWCRDGEAVILFAGRLSPGIEALGAVVAFAICDPVAIHAAMLEHASPARTANTRERGRLARPLLSRHPIHTCTLSAKQ